MTLNEKPFSKFDMNLLIVLLLVYQERSVSKAAAALRVGQPAVSASLRRLRHHFGNPLFIRCGGGVRPTPQCDEIVTKLMPPMSQIGDVLIAHQP